MSAATGTVTAAAPAPRQPAPRRAGESLAGTGSLVRFLARRDRVRIPVWLVAIVATVVGSAAAFADLFADDAEIAARVALIEGNPAGVALTGPGYGLRDASVDNLGPLVANELSATVLILVVLMSIFLVVRHTRAEEESGRAELVRAGVVGRHAALTATLVVVGGTNVVLGALLAVGMAGADLPWAGSVAFGASAAALGILFAAVAALTAQVTEYSRGAVGIALAVLGALFLVRAVGDATEYDDLRWYSPVGWAQAMRPYADERWWPAALLLGAAVVVAALAYALSTRRDLGAGLRRARPGRPRATALLTTPFGLAFRLQRGSLVSWGAGAFVGGIVGGVLLGESEALAEGDLYQQYMRLEPGQIVDSVTAFWFVFMALIACGYALQTVLRARAEETAGRAESVLATAVPRWRWAGSYLLSAVVGSAIVLALSGLGTGMVSAVNDEDAGEVARLVGAQMAHLPAVLLFVGLAFALFGLLPRAAQLVWALLGYNFLVWMFGGLTDLPDWLAGIAHFEHSPQAPIDDVGTTPLVVMSAIAVGLVVAGLVGFQRRDVESS